MNLRTPRWRLLGALLLGGWVSLSAQITTTIDSVEIRHVGPPAVSDDLIRAHIRVKAGDRYSQPATDDDVRTLLATGYFYNVRVVAERAGTGLKLVYLVQGKPVLTDIQFEGNTKFRRSKLLKKVPSKVGQPLDEYRLFTAAQEIQKLYQKAGYQKTKVEPKVTINENLGRGSVTFQITEAPKVRIVDVQFEGAQAFSQKRLRRVIKTRRHWMFSWITGSGKLKDEVFEEDKGKLRDFYQDAGYIDFDIRDIVFEQPEPDRMIIRFQVFEGRAYKVGKVEFQGNQVFTTEQIRAGVVVLGRPVRPRMLEGTTFTPKGLERDVEAIQDFYGARGYIGKGDAARIKVGAVKTPNVERGTMDLTYRIEEGEKSYIEKIEIKGNIRTRDKVIRRELAVTPGEVFDMVRVKISEERLNGLTYFTKVTTEVDPTDVPNRKNLIVDLEEGSSGNFYFGAGFSSIENLFGYVGMTQGNFDIANPPFFTGGGQKLRLQATIGTERKDYELRFVEPWFFNRKLAFELDLYHRDLQYLSDIYDQTETGARVGFYRALWIDQLRAGISYTIENLDIDFGSQSTSTNIIVKPGPGRGRTFVIDPPDVSPGLAQEEGSWLISKSTLSLAYDTRGGGLLPSRGQRTELAATLGGGVLGGDTDFYKLELETSWYFRGFARGHVLELIGRLGVLEPYGDSDRTHIWDRFYLGGAYTLRGFKFRDIGPKDAYGEPVGGNTYWMASLEYSIPIIERLRFALFYDIGTVNAEAYDFDTTNYADNVGVGLRINIPQMGPLRLDYGFPIHYDDTVDGKPRFQFSVGYSRPI